MSGLGDPVSGEFFFNRVKELDLLKRRLDAFTNEHQRRNIALIGLRKIGKSSLLDEFIKRNEKTENCFFVSVYLPESGGTDFIFKAMGRLIVGALIKKGESLPTVLTPVTTVPLFGKHYPKTAQVANEMLHRMNTNTPPSLEALLTFFDIFQGESELSLVLIFDEFQRICDYDFKTPIDTLREFMMRKNDIWFIVAGSSVGMLNRLVTSSTSPLFGHLEICPIKEFSFESSKEFIEKKLNPFIMSDTEIGFLFEITNGNPYYLDIITFRLKDISKEKNIQKISNEILTKALTVEMFSAGGAIYLFLSSLLETSFERGGFGSYVDILKAVAKGNARVSEIAKEAGLPLSSLPRYLKKLAELDIVGKRTNEKGKYTEYYFIDSIFELWLKEVYILREESLIPTLETKKKEFETHFKKIFSVYKTEVGKGNEARVRELFQLLDGTDKICGENIPKFDSVSNYSAESEEIDILAKKGTETWVAEVTDSNINIGDIKEFIKKINRMNLSDTNKIFIALSNIEQKTSNFCKTNKICLWNKNEVNRLMKKYGRKRILF
ncbi:MAG: ATP-binding protein [Candidatus Diapherotrites archaeon]|nr:ATP-binding protein [Candidatus Diapherotrites archaeon]